MNSSMIIHVDSDQYRLSTLVTLDHPDIGLNYIHSGAYRIDTFLTQDRSDFNLTQAHLDQNRAITNST